LTVIVICGAIVGAAATRIFAQSAASGNDSANHSLKASFLHVNGFVPPTPGQVARAEDGK
jgi:hypothetical protein